MRAGAVALPAASAKAQLVTALLCIAAIGIAWGTVQTPWLVAGAVLGSCVLALALTAPLALVAAMLVLGPVDLSFMTGGFKALFAELGGLDMNGIRLLGATAGFLAYVMFEPRSRAAAVGKLGRFWCVFLLYAAVTVAVSMDSLEGMRLLLKLAYPFLTFLIVIGVADSRARLDTLMRFTLLAAATYALVVNPILALEGGYRIEADGFVRVGGLGSGDNPFSFYLTIVLLIVFTRLLLRKQLGYLLFGAVLVVWIALTVTRIAVIASIVGLATVGLLEAWAAKNRKALAVSAMAAAAAGLLLVPNALARSLGYVPNPAELILLIRNPGALYESVNWQGRQLLWAILWGAFKASPIVGHGLGSSTAVLRETFPDQNVQVAHNEYLRLGTDVGLLGVTLFAVAVGAWLIGALRLGSRGDPLVREYAYPAVAAIIAWAIIATTDNPIDYYTVFTQYIGFLIAGAVVAHRSSQDENGTA